MSDEMVHDEFASEEPQAAGEPAPPSMAGEVKFGVALIGVLLLVFGGVVYWKLGAPGLPWAKTSVADSPTAAGEEGKAPGPESGAPVGTEQAANRVEPPVHVPPRMEAADPFGGARDRYANQQAAPTPLSEASAPAMPDPTTGGEPAERNAHDAGAVAADPFPSEPAPLPQTEAPGHIEKVAATAADPFRAVPDQELPTEPPREGGPLIAASEPESPPAGDTPYGLTPAAANEPTLAEPRDAPYGREPNDRYARGARQAPSDIYGEPRQQAPVSGRRGAAAEQQWNSTPANPTRSPRDAGQMAPPAGEIPRASGGRAAAPPPEEGFATPPDNFAGPPPRFDQAPPADGTYIVEPNDSFWTISQKVYGTGGYFKAIQRHNRKPGSRAEGLSIGEKILVPPAEVLEQKYPDLCPKRRGGAGQGGRGGQAFPASSRGGGQPGRVYVVRQGDTLFDIAKYELGKASRWAEIYELNRHTLGDDHNYVAPGTRLVLPDSGGKPETITSRPATQYQR